MEHMYQEYTIFWNLISSSKWYPRKVFHCRRGDRQGDPLSPLLFVLTVDLLQLVINKAKDMGLLKLPINVGYTDDYPIIQYADDTLLIIEACPS
jgi:hypothetical protein